MKNLLRNGGKVFELYSYSFFRKKKHPIWVLIDY